MTRLSHTLASVLRSQPRSRWLPPRLVRSRNSPMPTARPSTPGSRSIVRRRRSPRCAGMARSIFLKGHNADPRAPSLIGSMSKPITGVCIATLIRDGKLTFTTPLREALAGFFRRHGAPADRRLAERDDRAASGAPLGPAGNDEDDPMQEIWRRRAAQGLAHIASPEPLLVEHFKRPLAHEPGSHSFLHQHRLCRAERGHRGDDRQGLRDLLPGGGVRPARHCERAAASGLAAVRRARAAGSSRRGLPRLPRRVRPEASVSRRPGEGVDRRDRDAMGQGLSRPVRRARHRDRDHAAKAGTCSTAAS